MVMLWNAKGSYPFDIVWIFQCSSILICSGKERSSPSPCVFIMSLCLLSLSPKSPPDFAPSVLNFCSSYLLPPVLSEERRGDSFGEYFQQVWKEDGALFINCALVRVTCASDLWCTCCWDGKEEEGFKGASASQPAQQPPAKKVPPAFWCACGL